VKWGTKHTLNVILTLNTHQTYNPIRILVIRVYLTSPGICYSIEQLFVDLGAKYIYLNHRQVVGRAGIISPQVVGIEGGDIIFFPYGMQLINPR